MFHPGPCFGFGPVAALRLRGQRLAAPALAVDVALRFPIPQPGLHFLRATGRVRPDAGAGVAPHRQGIHRLAVMQSGICHVTAAHRLVPAVYIHVVPVTVMRLPVLPGPAGIGVLPRSFGGCAGPVLRDLAVPDGPVLIAGIVIARHRDNGRIQDLSAPGDIAPAGQKTVESGKRALDRPRLRKSLAIEPDRLRIRDTILKAQPGKPHERKAVAHLIFDPVVRQVIKRARDRRPEHRYRVHRLAPRPGFALRIRLAPGPFRCGGAFAQKVDFGA